MVGYSGENDPVFDHLARVQQFDNNLYWVCYRDNEPPKHVRERLLVSNKFAFFVKGFAADDFFVGLAQRLNCFPPDLVRKPFSHLKNTLESLTSYAIPGQTAQLDVTEDARKLADMAIQDYEQEARGTARLPLRTEVPAVGLMAQSFLMAGEYDKVVSLRVEYDRGSAAELAGPLSWAYLMQGNALSAQAKTKSGEEADRLFALAGEKSQAALQIKPDMHEALNNWGTALSAQARTKSGEEADRLFALAGEKH